MTDYKANMCEQICLVLNKQYSLPFKELYNILCFVTKDYEITRSCQELVTVENSDIEILQKFIVCKKIEGLSDKTLRYYSSQLKNFYGFLNHHKSLIDVTTDDIRCYLADGTLNKNWSGGNADNVRRILSTFYHWCVDEYYMDRNPCSKIKNIKKRKTVRVPFTEEEIEKMRDYLVENNDIRDRAIFELLLSTGSRVSEICNIKMENVNILSKEVKVIGKGNKERICYLNEKALYYLKKYLEGREKDKEFLFYSLLGGKLEKPLQISGVEIMIRKLGRSLGIEAYPHKFRHTAATLALKRGMPIDQVRIMLGHEKIDTTLIYAQNNTDDIKLNHNKFMQ